MVSPKLQIMVKEAIPGSKAEWWIKMPIITLTIIFLAITGALVDVCEYSAQNYGGVGISYNKAYHYLPPLIFIIYCVYFYGGLFAQHRAYNKITPPLPREHKIVKLTWGMTITAICFVLLQLKVLSLLAIQFLPNLPK